MEQSEEQTELVASAKVYVHLVWLKGYKHIRQVIGPVGKPAAQTLLSDAASHSIESRNFDHRGIAYRWFADDHINEGWADG